MGVILVVQWCGDTKVTQEDSAVVINEEIGRFDIPVDKPIDMQVAARWARRVSEVR